MRNKAAEYTVSLCPFFQMGVDKCYHMQHDSRKVYLAIRYCQKNHLDCDVYNELVNSELNSKQRVKGVVK